MGFYFIYSAILCNILSIRWFGFRFEFGLVLFGIESIFTEKERLFIFVGFSSCWFLWVYGLFVIINTLLNCLTLSLFILVKLYGWIVIAAALFFSKPCFFILFWLTPLRLLILELDLDDLIETDDFLISYCEYKLFCELILT